MELACGLEQAVLTLQRSGGYQTVDVGEVDHIPQAVKLPGESAIDSTMHIHYFASSLSTSAMRASGSAVLSR